MNEILFQNSVLTLRTLNIVLVLGFFFAGTFSIRYIEKHKLNITFLSKYFLHILIPTLVIGRLLYVLQSLSTFSYNYLSILYIWDLNFSFFGMAIGGITSIGVLSKRDNENFWDWADVAALSSLAMLIFVNIGYFFSGKDYGRPTDLPWGIPFEAKNIPFVSPLHPTQLYAAFLALIILIQSVKASKRTHLSGVVGAKAIMVYSLGMLGISFLHGDPSVYSKIGYLTFAAIAFIASVHCGHKTHVSN